MEVKDYPQAAGADRLGKVITYQGGLGHLFSITAGDYEFGIRAEALYRYGHRDKVARPTNDPDIARDFDEIFVNLGLQLPLAAKPPAPAPVVVPTVVAPPPPADSDGDGVTDDRDQCPGTPPGTQVNEVGCPLPPPPPPCKTPEVGERIDLSGCGTGDTIVLRGVNFDFDKASLTANAKVILDGVADSLIAQPQIQIELGGHTDSKGSDEYNQSLSDRRAASVVDYLVGRGIDAGRMTSHGYGETQPVADNETDEGREINRRVELKITGSKAP
jgi:outer membrane protein OmpA-like peptidoglycan-associated protein